MDIHGKAVDPVTIKFARVKEWPVKFGKSIALAAASRVDHRLQISPSAKGSLSSLSD